MGTIGVAKIQKKRRNLEKSYPDTFYTLLDVLIVSHMLEILCSYGRNTAQLLMSSELGHFEGTGANFLDISHCTTTVQWSDFNGKYYCFIRYLGAQCTVSVHTLQFRSAHQYYQTAKYQLHRTTGDKDMLLLIFQIPNRWTN